MTCIQADGGLVLGSKRVGDGDRRNRSEEEDDRQRWHDMLLALEEVVEGGWMQGSMHWEAGWLSLWNSRSYNATTNRSRCRGRDCR